MLLRRCGWLREVAQLRPKRDACARRRVERAVAKYSREGRTERASSGDAPLSSPRVRTKPIVIVLDNGPIHVSNATAAALAARAQGLTVEWLPKYAPELNDIEMVWHDLKAFNLAHKTFIDVDTLHAAIHGAVADLNTERNRDLLGESRISA
jgi:transposase